MGWVKKGFLLFLSNLFQFLISFFGEIHFLVVLVDKKYLI